MENGLQKLVDILSKKFSTTFDIKSKKSEIDLNFQVPLHLDSNLNYELALTYFSTFNNIFNVTDLNNLIHVTVTDSKQKKINKKLKLPPGAYEIEDISKAINNVFKFDKELEPLKEKEFYIKINPNPISSNCILKLAKGCEVSFPKENSLATLLGFETDKIYSTGIHYSKKVNITEINRITIDCDIVDGCFIEKDGMMTTTNKIYSFPANNVRRWRRIIERPMFPVYYPVTRKTINKIRFRILDDNENLINFNDEEIIFTVHLKQV